MMTAVEVVRVLKSYRRLAKQDEILLTEIIEHTLMKSSKIGNIRSGRKTDISNIVVFLETLRHKRKKIAAEQKNIYDLLMKLVYNGDLKIDSFFYINCVYIEGLKRLTKSKKNVRIIKELTGAINKNKITIKKTPLFGV